MIEDESFIDRSLGEQAKGRNFGSVEVVGFVYLPNVFGTSVAILCEQKRKQNNQLIKQ